MTAIDTAKAQRRSLTFNSIDDVLREIDRIIAAEQQGTLRTTGNWSAGQIFNHLASWIDYGYDGFPAKANPPWFVKIMLRMQKYRYIRKGAPPGINIPGIPGGTFGIEPMSTHEGAAKLKKSLMRLKYGEPATFHSPAFGPVTEQQRIAMQLRHAELHLSFLHY